MLLLLHISIALSSLGFTSYAWLQPSPRKLHVSYGLVAATLTSGAWLVVSTRSPLLGSCVSGLIYLGIVSSGLVATHRKLVRVSV